MTAKKLHRYRVVEVWGWEGEDEEPPVKVGDVIVDQWKGRGEQVWQIKNFRTMTDVGGWAGYYLGKHEDVA